MCVYLVWERQGLLGLTVLLKIFKNKNDANMFVNSREVRKWFKYKVEVRTVI